MRHLPEPRERLCIACSDVRALLGALLREGSRVELGERDLHCVHGRASDLGGLLELGVLPGQIGRVIQEQEEAEEDGEEAEREDEERVSHMQSIAFIRERNRSAGYRKARTLTDARFAPPWRE